MKHFRCKTVGDKVLVDFCGQVQELPYQTVIEIAKGLLVSAKMAEEYANANKIIFDHAILTRSGAPFGLSNNKVIKDEVRKETAWNSILRRYMKRNKAKEVFGTPTLIQGVLK